MTSLTAKARNIHCSADERKWPRLRKAVSGSLFNASGAGYSQCSPDLGNTAQAQQLPLTLLLVNALSAPSTVSSLSKFFKGRIVSGLVATMGNAFRQQPGPTLYPENKTPVTEDILEAGLGVAFAMIAFSFILIIPGIRGWEVRSNSGRY